MFLSEWGDFYSIEISFSIYFIEKKNNNLSAQLNSHTPRHSKGNALIFPFKPKYCGMVCTSFYILYRTYNKQGGLARLFSRVFFLFFICICARHFTILYINTHGLELYTI